MEVADFTLREKAEVFEIAEDTPFDRCRRGVLRCPAAPGGTAAYRGLRTPAGTPVRAALLRRLSHSRS